LSLEQKVQDAMAILDKIQAEAIDLKRVLFRVLKLTVGADIVEYPTDAKAKIIAYYGAKKQDILNLVNSLP